jgi:hypothetical protein
MAEFLNALGTSSRRFVVVALPIGNRTVLELTASDEVPGGSPKAHVGDLFSQLVGDLAGKVAITAVQANMRSAARERELRQRLLPGISSGVQIGYFALLIAGLVGVPVSRVWWRGIWPPEMRAEYAGRAGYLAARATRALAFCLVFVPLTAPVAVIYNLSGQIRDAVAAPVRCWRFLSGRTAAAQRQSIVAAARSREDNMPEPIGTASDREWQMLDRFLSRWPNRSRRTAHDNARG